MGSTNAGVAVNETSVLSLSAAWACINLLAGTIGSLPLVVYRNDSAGNRVVAKDHPLYRVLHDSPNYDQTALDFWEGGQVALEVRGNLCARIERNAGRVVALHPIANPTVTRQSNGSLRYRWTENGKSYDEPQENVFHVRGFGGSPLGGLSTLSYGRQVFGLSLAVDNAAQTTFANGVRPSLLLTVPNEKTLTADQRDALEKALQEKHQGAMNAGRPMLIEGGLTPHQVSLTPEDAQMLESRAFSVEEICRFFEVPPHMIGHTEKSTSWGTGLEEQTLRFQKFTLRRRLKRIEQAIMKQLLTPADRAAGIVVEFNLEGLLRADSKGRSEFYQKMTQIGAMTINEVRALENLPPVAGGDVPRMQAQNIPINMANPPALVAGGGE
ncbi:phage portal protein [Brevundimonas sp.]|uniref:phage portal protein n=1 Tax=Brevundimonas sp. TaxID=1871086 RepID=UPI0028A1E290|nr:phage portal protein [Brevundimonas sp.]